MRNVWLAIILCSTAFSQTARFPTALAGDQDLTVQKDKAQSTLTTALNSSATSFTVVSGSKFAANMILSIENEQVLTCSVVGNTVNVGYASCPNIDGRAYAGTSVASHANGLLVSANVVSWAHDSVAAELKAIQTALGINLANVPTPVYPIAVNKGGTGATTQPAALAAIMGASALPVANGGTGATTQPAALAAIMGGSQLPVANGGTGTPSVTGVLLGSGTGSFAGVTGAQRQQLRVKPNVAGTVYEFADPSALITTDFAFPTQVIGDSSHLLAPGSNAVLLLPVPLGVNGANLNHALYVSGGVGTAETCPIVGGGALSGLSSGTVFINCAVAHSGAWTIQSATAGIEEAIQASAGSSVFIPAGTYSTYGTITVPASMSPEIYGAGPAQSTIAPQFAIGDVIGYAAGATTNFHMHDFGIAAGVRTSGYNIAIRGMSSGLLSNIYSTGGYNAVLFEGGNGEFSDTLHLVGFSNIGVDIHANVASGMGGIHRNWITSGGGTAIADLLLRADVTGGFAGMAFSNLDLQLALYNIEIFSNGGVTNELFFSNSILDSALTGGWGIYAHGSPGGNGIHFTGLRAATAGGGIAYFNSSYSDVMISNCSGSTSSAANAAGFQFAGTQNVAISNCNISGNGQGFAANTSLVITTDPVTAAPVNQVRVSNSSFGLSGLGLGAGGTSVAQYGATISAAAHSGIQFSDVSFYGAASYLTNAGTLPLALSGFLPGISNVGATVTAAATTAFPLNPFFTLSGSAAVTAVTSPLAASARWTFIPTSATPGLWSGATIGSPFTPVQNVPVTCVWDGSKVWCK